MKLTKEQAAILYEKIYSSSYDAGCNHELAQRTAELAVLRLLNITPANLLEILNEFRLHNPSKSYNSC